MTHPIESTYDTPWDYARALEAYCDAQAMEIERLGKEYVFQQSQIKQFEQEYVAHKAEIERLQADAARYQWLRLNAFVDVMKLSPRVEGPNTIMFDDTIAAAMAKESK